MTNDNYTVEKRGVQIQSFTKEQPKQRELTEVFLTSGDNYTVATANPEAFSFTLSQNSISFGPLQATNPVIRELNLQLTSLRGYQVLAAADHSLQKQAQIFIPDTTCDNGSCSEFTPAPWKNTLTYGFGYRQETMEADNYKQFADLSRNESLQPIFEGLQAQNVKKKITYRVNISGTQPSESYTNTIFYIATPDY